MDIIDLLPLVMDIKREIKIYLIPRPPLYGFGKIKNCHMVNSVDGI